MLTPKNIEIAVLCSNDYLDQLNVLSLTSKNTFQKVFFEKLSLIEDLDSKMMEILLQYKKLDEK